MAEEKEKESDPLKQRRIIYDLFMRGQHLSDSTVYEITKGKINGLSFKRIVSDLIRRGVLVQHKNVDALHGHYYNYFLPIDFKEMDTVCDGCGKSCWIRDGKCNVCGKERKEI